MLSDFGLTLNQAKVYLTISKLGVATVSQVSEISKVRREDIYRMLPKLEKLGLIERLLGKPLRLKAEPIKDALPLLIDREQDLTNQKIAELKMKKDVFLKSIEDYNLKTKFEETHFTLLSEREGTIYKGLTMLKAAEREFSIIMASKPFTILFANYHDPIITIMRRGVRFRIVLDTSEPDDAVFQIIKKYVASKAPLDIKYTDQSTSRYAIVDNKEALIATSTAQPTINKQAYLWTNDTNFITILQKNFERIWQSSIKKRPSKPSRI